MFIFLSQSNSTSKNVSENFFLKKYNHKDIHYTIIKTISIETAISKNMYI